MSEPRRDPGRLGGGKSRQWRSEFPYHWEADEVVSRRELLQLTVYASGALFSVTALLAVMGWIRPRRSYRSQFIARLDQVPEGEAFYFNYPGPEDQAVLLHLPGDRYVAYSQVCTHMSCVVYYQKAQRRLFCPCHDGVFEPQTGAPIAGPPQRRLPRIRVERVRGGLYATGEEA